jgi:hypothetical protein
VKPSPFLREQKDHYFLKAVTVREFQKVNVELHIRGRKWQEAGEDCIMRSFITCTLHQILLW